MPNGRRWSQLVRLFTGLSFRAVIESRGFPAPAPWPVLEGDFRALGGGVLARLLLPGTVVLLLGLAVNPVERHARDLAEDQEVVPAEARRRLPPPLAVLVGAGQGDAVPGALRLVMVLPDG